MNISVWDYLEIEKTCDLDKIKKAYKKTLKKFQVERKLKELADLNDKYTEIVNEIKLYLQKDEQVEKDFNSESDDGGVEFSVEKAFAEANMLADPVDNNIVDVSIENDEVEENILEEDGFFIDIVNDEEVALEGAINILNEPLLRNSINVWKEFFGDNLTSYNLEYFRRYLLEALILNESNSKNSFLFIKQPEIYNILDEVFELEYAQVYKELTELFEEEYVDKFYSALDLAKSIKERSLAIDFKVPVEMEEDYDALISSIYSFEYEDKDIDKNTFKKEIQAFNRRYKKEKVYKKYLAYKFYNMHLLSLWPSREAWGAKGVIYRQLKENIGVSYKKSAKYLPKTERKILKEIEGSKIMPYIYTFIFFKGVVLVGKYFVGCFNS